MTMREAQAPDLGHDHGVWAMLNSSARIVCLICGETTVEEEPFWGCLSCGDRAPLTVAYGDQDDDNPDLPPVDAAKAARRAFSLFADGQDGASTWATPLTPATRLGPRVFLKHETYSLTNSHKDRYQAVASRMARVLGMRGVVASSTGNHGVSAAAHAAAAGLPSVVFCHREAPAGLLRAIGAFGGVAAQVPAAEQRAALVELVNRGWFPATSLDPELSGAANPFGAEGYKAIAYEVVEQLSAMPDAIFIPTAGGDTLYGISRGLAEVAELAGVDMPRVFAVQPAGANSLSQSIAAGQQVALAHPSSLALSIADAQSGRHAIAALATWEGQVVDVSEDGIRSAISDLAHLGIYTDPASAAALAGYRRAVATGALEPKATAVLLLTSSGFKWPNAMADVFKASAVHGRDELWQRLAHMMPANIEHGSVR
jgi:threonine synthase